MKFWTQILYLMRHVQTVFNLKGKIQGASDSPLTDHGIEQAQAAARYFENNHIEFDFAYRKLKMSGWTIEQ